MLGWLGPKCPLDTGEKMWTEFRMRWLAGKLGLDRLIGSDVICRRASSVTPWPGAPTPAEMSSPPGLATSGPTAQPLKGGLRYLLKTGDSLFHPDTAHQPVNPPTEAEVIKRLSTGSPTVRAMTLRDIAALDPPPVALIEAVVRRLRDRDTDVQIEAARVLPLFGNDPRGFLRTHIAAISPWRVLQRDTSGSTGA
jgi:hypothetical protein